MADDRLDCGHTQAEHEEIHDLHHLMHSIQEIKNPRVALVVEESGEVHFATTMPPGEAAEALIEMGMKIKRYGGNYVRDHFDRGRSAQLN